MDSRHLMINMGANKMVVMITEIKDKVDINNSNSLNNMEDRDKVMVNNKWTLHSSNINSHHLQNIKVINLVVKDHQVAGDLLQVV